ncbi:metal-sulfur cluster assembly factor [Companilactobacillus baiquanensis]|uniref:Metal-sulfur cluster assembly factor n=1 Tax=Companilactobacillus baiquanensis TaxID=2486005 RepID=A0ABW1UWG8_9LACO|nr:metal-sulfur cluster assembly factor [Companilactobacillus baiquanensis]
MMLEKINQTLSTIIDPDMQIDIVNLGLIYNIEVTKTTCMITMTMPTRSCQYGESIVSKIKKAIEDLDGITTCNINLVWDPIWTKDKMSKLARLSLGV